MQDANFVKILSRVNELLPLIQLKTSSFNLFLLTRSYLHFNKNKTIPIFVNIFLLYPGKMEVFRGKLESACLSIHLSVCVQNTSVCESAGRGIKSHLVTALVLFTFKLLSANASNLDQSKILSSGNGFIMMNVSFQDIGQSFSKAILGSLWLSG